MGREVQSYIVPEISGFVYKGPVPSIKVVGAIHKRGRQGWVVVRGTKRLESVKNKQV
jgi:hypothetical protein